MCICKGPWDPRNLIQNRGFFKVEHHSCFRTILEGSELRQKLLTAQVYNVLSVLPFPCTTGVCLRGAAQVTGSAVSLSVRQTFQGSVSM